VNTKTATLTRTNPLVREVVIMAFFAALTALGAQVAIRLPFSPVPVTLQVMMVIVAGLALGSRRGLTSQLAYLTAGAMGLAVFAGGSGGVAVLLGPTGGYLAAFPPAAFVAGLLSEKLGRDRAIGFVAASLAAIALIYCGGSLWLAVWLKTASLPASGDALAAALNLGVKPFILADLAKAIAAAIAIQEGRALLVRWLGVAD
jgi:biotin transport system substrate-specific component